MIYIYVRIENSDSSTEKRKKYPPQADDASTAEAAPSRFGRDEKGEAHRENTTPNGEPHLELRRLRFKTSSKSCFSIAQTTWPTHLTHIFILSARAYRKRVHSFRVYVEQIAWTFPLLKGRSVPHHFQNKDRLWAGISCCRLVLILLKSLLLLFTPNFVQTILGV